MIYAMEDVCTVRVCLHGETGYGKVVVNVVRDIILRAS
jgi:hypothetical protein